MDAMTQLMNKMAKAKGDSGFVVFVKHQSVPGAQPMRGRPHGTREDAEKAARSMLTPPTSFVAAWVVGRDGVRPVE